jgi:predicted Ser/Thr protein kinase
MQQQIKKMKRVGSYRLDESMVLGKGSTGFVYAGTKNGNSSGFHSETNERVAIKAIDMKYINNDVTRYLL